MKKLLVMIMMISSVAGLKAVCFDESTCPEVTIQQQEENKETADTKKLDTQEAKKLSKEKEDALIAEALIIEQTKEQ
ncbi:MAG: hypothetical protein AB7R69_04210 [Candidatus Babeliales bacterium]